MLNLNCNYPFQIDLSLNWVNKTEFRWVSNQSENGKWYLILIWLKIFSKDFSLCVMGPRIFIKYFSVRTVLLWCAYEREAMPVGFELFAVKSLTSSGRVHRGIASQSRWIKPDLDFNYTFLIDLASNKIPFVAKSIGKV